MEKIDQIFFKKINPGDLWNIDRAKGTVKGGGGQTFIDLAGIDDYELQEFLKYGDIQDKPDEERKIITIKAYMIGNSSRLESITFDPRPNRPNYRINNQHTHRHPAWHNSNGFPTIPHGASQAKDVSNIPYLTIFIVRTKSKKYYAGYINEEKMPCNWPKNYGLEAIFEKDRKGIIKIGDNHIPDEVNRVLKCFHKKPNVLLYGPPATGKTYVMQWLWEKINNGIELNDLVLDEESHSEYFIEEVIECSFDKLFGGNTRTEWLTFHQDMSHEEFMLGLRPKTASGGTVLQPKMGVLMDIISDINTNKFDNAVIFIDELNRGNVARIFGQLITFMEYDKRNTKKDGSINGMRLPIPLPQLTISGNKTESIESISGQLIQLDYPIYFPRNIYIIASMNSVDKSISPIDSALARRFDKIEYTTNYNLLKNLLHIEDENIKIENKDNWNAKETAFLLLKRINNMITLALGKNHVLGHAYIMQLANIEDDSKAFDELCDIWELTLMPQIMDKLFNRQFILNKLLKIEEANNEKIDNYPYLIQEINEYNDYNEEYICEINSLYESKYSINKIQVLRFLAYE